MRENPTAPVGTLDQRFSAPDLPPTPWPDVEAVLTSQEMAWITSVRTDGRPHVTPLVFCWAGGHLLVHTGVGEQKTANLEADPRCVLTVGQPDFGAGLDVVVEGAVRRVTDRAGHEQFATAMAAKYGPTWTYDVDDQGIVDPESDRRPIVLEVVPTKVLAFGKGDRSGQTTFRF